jgi:hypothetical protein
MRAFVKDRFEDDGSVREVADPIPSTGDDHFEFHAALIGPPDDDSPDGLRPRSPSTGGARGDSRGGHR